jgi:hypothetical protein
LAVIGKQGRLDPEILRLVPPLADRALPFAHMPYRAETWASAGGRVALFAWDNDVHAAPAAPLIRVDGRQAVAFAGYVSHPDLTSPADVPDLVRTPRRIGQTVADLGGVFALFKATEEDEDVTAWNSVTRLVPVYWIDAPGFFAVGTRALLLAFLLARSPRPAYEPANLASFLSVGYYANEDTPFWGVRVLPPNSRLRASRVAVTVGPLDEFDRSCGSIVPSDEDYDALAALLAASVRPLRGSDVLLRLSGGKDSRLAAAALRAAGVEFTAWTDGFPDHPDVVVATRIAEILGAPLRTRQPVTNERYGRATLSVDVLDRARRALFGAEGMLYAYEDRAFPSASAPIR